MATWKKVIVSGSNAELNQITASGGVNATLPNTQQANFVTYNLSTNQFGYFNTGSLTATTASYVASSGVNGPFGANSILTASYATTASFVTQAVSSSYALSSSNAQTASFVQRAQTASYVLQAVSASFATLAQTANTASYVITAQTASFVTQAVSASFATLAQTANTASYVITAQTASYVNGNIFTSTNPATSASYAASVNNLTNAITNNADNRILTATNTGTINGESNLSFDGVTNTLSVTGNAVITNNLIVQGTASFQNTTNLEVADRFVLFASGSTSTGDGGIVVQQGTQNVGELFAYENSVNRWGFTSSFNASSPTYTAAAYITTTEFAAANPTAAPTYGSSSFGFGNIYVNSNTGDIFIYA